MKKPIHEQVMDAAAAPAPAPVAHETLSRRNGLSSGSTLLNLALTGSPHFAFIKGHYYFIVGDSASGKTVQTLTMFAEAAASPRFRDYAFIYDNPEERMLFDTDGLFGMAVSDRVRPPSHTAAGAGRNSKTLEEFYYHLDDLGKAGRPFIYVLDSIDALNPEADEKKFDQQKKAHDKARRKEEGEDTRGEGKDEDEKVAGSYGMARAKLNSSNLRHTMRLLADTGSLLFVISQTRINVGGYGKTRGGGEALRFYATCEFWSSIVEVLKKTVRDKARQVGVRVKFQVRKNSHTGKLFSIENDIYPSYGIDDIGGCVDYLLEEGFWSKQKESIIATLDGMDGVTASRERLVRWLEEDAGRLDALRALVGRAWAEIDEACSLKRKRRYL